MGVVSGERERGRIAQQIASAAQRYAASAEDRARLEDRTRTSGTSVSDTIEQVEPRALRLATTGQLPTELLLAAGAGDGVRDRHQLLERIIAASNDLQAVNFLGRGARAARSVARISIEHNSRIVAFGTGFLVAPNLLLTNNHVLPDVATAQRCVAEFDAEVDLDLVNAPVRRHRLDPERLLLTDEHLDYTLVAVRDGDDGVAPGERSGWIQLRGHQGKIVIGEPVNVIGHPLGRLKEIAIRDNALENQLEHFLQYSADTEPGNSGSPVFNDQWEVVALHHAGVPRTDADGNYLTTDGAVWQPSDGDAAIAWSANEGARISVILADMVAREVTSAQADLLATLGDAAHVPAAPPAIDLRHATVAGQGRLEELVA